MREILNWFFVDRRSGAVVIAQWPNLLLSIAIVAGICTLTLPPGSTAGAAIKIVAKGALILWALDEIIRGVNPWRRSLGTGVLAYELWSLV